MLEIALSPSQGLSKAEYKALLVPLQSRLLELQRQRWRNRLPSIALFEGWDTAGRGAVIRKLTERLEPRGFQLHTIRERRSSDLQLPWMARFWRRLPAYGEIAIFDYSWYRRLFSDRAEKTVSRDVWEDRLRDVTAFEKALVADRTPIVKFFLHISREEKRGRLERRSRNSLERWRVGKDAWRLQDLYDDYHRAIRETLQRTHSALAPWTVIEASDTYGVRILVLETLVRALEGASGRFE